jgi:hypothetical protein
MLVNIGLFVFNYLLSFAKGGENPRNGLKMGDIRVLLAKKRGRKRS